MIRSLHARLVAAVVLGLAVTAPGGATAQSAQPTAPSAEPAQPLAPSTLPSVSPLRTLPEQTAPLVPGRYASDALGSRLTFDLADDRWTGDQSPGEYLELIRQIGDAQGVLSVSLFDGSVASDPCLPAWDGTVEKTAAGLTEWLTGLGALPVSTTPVTLLGQAATQVDGVVLGSACPNSPFILLWNGFRLYPSEAIRVIAFDHGDSVIVISAETVQSTDQADFLDIAQPVINSMTIAESGSAAPLPSVPSA